MDHSSYGLMLSDTIAGVIVSSLFHGAGRSHVIHMMFDLGQGDVRKGSMIFFYLMAFGLL